MRKIGHFFWLKREKWFRPHPHTVRTDGRRGRTDAQRLAALRWPRFPFWGVLFNWSPLSFDLLEKKNATFLTIFHSFPKSMFLPCFNHCSQCDRFQPGFRHCSRFVPVFLTPRLVSQRPNWQCLLNKTKTSPKCVRIPPVLCAVAINNGDRRSVLLIGRYMPIYWQYPNAIST